MKLELDPHKTIHDNAQRYYEEAKKLKSKIKGIKKALEDSQKKLEEARKQSSIAEIKSAPRIKEARKREWFEKFHWFVTSRGRLTLAGREAKQNEVLVAKHFEDNDLFFHADVIGAPATILKDGLNADEQEKKEAAAFAAAYSAAWKQGVGSTDVYAAKREQVSKATESGEYVKKGGFIIRGQREWFRGTPLRLIVAKQDEKPIVLPFNHAHAPSARVVLSPGQAQRAEIAEAIKSRLRLNTAQDALALLPGACSLLD